ncbi:MAG: EAL domain-containing protein [Eubacterium sp.]
MSALKTVLIVDDNAINRMILSKILNKDYKILQAENGKMAMQLLNENSSDIVAVMLDIVMPVMDGYAFLECIQNDGRYDNLPIIVMTENDNKDNEIKVLALGAWDFVSKPYNAEIIKFRLKNAIDRSQLSAFTQLKYLAEFDDLTGIYNKKKFFDVTHEMIRKNLEKSYVFLRFDIDRFQLINSFFGTDEGDRLLVFIAKKMAYLETLLPEVTYGRIESDVFCLCIPNDDEKCIKKIVEEAKSGLTAFNQNYNIVPSIGIYKIDDNTLSVETMYNRATLAAKTCKGNYVNYYAFYDESMSLSLAGEQEIINEMNVALEKNQFEIYFQPKYNIQNNRPCGAEALVRWMHPIKGMLTPDSFIAIFERNGFITKLDNYVWERTCQYIRGWLDAGIKPYPVSVNISRVNIYNPRLVETLIELVEKYEINPAILNLELTESAYMDNPVAMIEIVTKLQNYGFIIMMDDFGSGYSSLSILKDIPVDILKIDMRFLSKTKIPGRGENIIASVMRMAQWLSIPVITEGVETLEQVDFLRSVGCKYVQGYYYARPMPIEDYERLCDSQIDYPGFIPKKNNDRFHFDDLFVSNSEIEGLFDDHVAAAIYEFVEDHIEMIRVNDAFYYLLGHEDTGLKSQNPIDLVDENHRKSVTEAFRTCAENHETAECKYIRRRINRSPLWIHIELKYLSKVGDKHIIVGKLVDITMRKEIDQELERYRMSLLAHDSGAHTILIVDDAGVNRKILKKIFENKYQFLEAENGEEAIEILKENKNSIDLILLDIIMPKMNGKEFLKYKKKFPEYDSIPVIMITADDSPEQQINTLSLGANDYIVKPFIPEVVVRRVNNVLESNRRFKELVKEYNDMSYQAKTDQMTGLYNRTSAENIITQHLKSDEGLHAMMMLDIDNFKKFNDFYGHAYGDKVITAFAEKLKSYFNENDIVARMGGDEFSVFMSNIASKKSAEKKAYELCTNITNIVVDGEAVAITGSIGIVVSSDGDDTFDLLYKNADKALYNAKCRGKNRVSVYSR